MSEKKSVYSLHSGNFLNFIWGFFFIIFPLFFLTFTTENFVLPKQVLVALIAIFSLLGIGIRSVIDKKVFFRESILDLPVFLFILSLLLSTIFSVDRINSIITFVPVLFLACSYFIITNTVRTEQIAFYFVSAILISGCIVALLAIFSFLKAYIIPFGFTHVQYFSTFGSLLDQAIYLVALIPIALYFAYPIIKGRSDGRVLCFGIISLILIAGFALSVYQLLTSQKPIILPFTSGFQIAFAAISQDSPRIAQGFFLGSGYGTFFTAFTRFKQPAFNIYQNLWFLNFTQSTSFLLELLTTSGLLGVLSFLFILARALTKPLKTMDNPLFFSIVILGITAFILPYSYTILALLFFLLAIFSSAEGLKNPEKSLDLELSLIALKRNLLNLHSTDQHVNHKPSQALPITFLVLIIIISGILGYYSIKYLTANILFDQSLIAAANNNGALTYQKQVAAITMFPYNDGYYRIFSQTNLSIANSLLALTASHHSTNPQDQTTALNLIQQSINVARTATSLSPMDTLNWQNLASVYRSLINFGQNADQFAIATTQQSIVLDSANPQEYLTLGGIYYQLGQYDNAIRQFQIAVNLKPDYPNAYYNLGHAYEAKGDLQNALTNYENVRNLVQNDKTNLDKINSEIDTLNAKLNSSSGQNGNKKPTTEPTPTLENQQLNLNESTTQLPKQAKQIKLPPPTATNSAK